MTGGVLPRFGQVALPAFALVALTGLSNAYIQVRHPSLLWETPDGRLLFNACLDGLGTALLAYDGANFQPVIAAGTPSNTPATLVSDLGRHSLS